jgi:hypothetical protein
MLQYDVGAPFEWIATNIARPFRDSKSGSQHFLTAMDCFTKWPDVYATLPQKAWTVENTLVTNFFCCFEVPRELHSD